jgi:hypothetical protein
MGNKQAMPKMQGYLGLAGKSMRWHRMEGDIVLVDFFGNNYI